MMRTTNGKRGRRGAAWLLALAAMWYPAAASATVFSFGTVNPGDVISKLTLAPGTTQTTYNPVTNMMHIEAYVSTVNFTSRQIITDPLVLSVAANTVLFTSDLTLVGGSVEISFLGGATNPRSLNADFMNGALQDFSIWDNVNSLTVLNADFVGALEFNVRETGSLSPLSGDLTGSVASLASSDPDFLSAFGPLSTLNASYNSFFSDGVTTGAVIGNMCHVAKDDGLLGATSWPTSCAGPYGLDDFAANAGMTITPTVIPEPGTAMLLGLGLAGVAALRRK
jgi:hypothetical protein